MARNNLEKIEHKGLFALLEEMNISIEQRWLVIKLLLQSAIVSSVCSLVNLSEVEVERVEDLESQVAK